MQLSRLVVAGTFALGCCAYGVAAETAAGSSTFKEAPGEGFQFSTDQIEGTIRLDGAYHGVTRLVDKRSGRQVIDPRYSALNLFKLMSANLMMGQPRQMERTTRSGSDWLEIVWPATESHLAELVARYQLCPPAAVDLSVTVKAKGSYAGYELFLSSYFDKALRPQVWLQARKPAEIDRVLPTLSDVFRGTVLVFPRDPHAARRCVDGRWERSENRTPVVQMCPVRRYAHCLALQADPEGRLGVLLMADPRDCYALSTRYHAEAEVDRLTTYSAFDMSLFGVDLVPGDQRSVRVRLALVDLAGDLDRAVKSYRDFLGRADGAPRKATE